MGASQAPYVGSIPITRSIFLMKNSEMTCIVCPIGCRLSVETAEDGAYVISGNECKRGRDYAIQESTCPVRTLTSSVRVVGGKRPVCSCKTAKPVPKTAIPACLKKLHGMRVQAPIRLGDVLCENLAGTGVPLVATAHC